MKNAILNVNQTFARRNYGMLPCR